MPFKRTFGILSYSKIKDEWKLDKLEPHACIMLKRLFKKINKSDTVFYFKNTIEQCSNLKWFTDKYPVKILKNDRKLLLSGDKKYFKTISARQSILLPKYKPKIVKLNSGKRPRAYQLRGNDFFDAVNGRLLLADELGLGKTLSALLGTMKKGRLPALVVCPAQLSFQWQAEIEKYTNLTSQIITGHKVYDLKSADIYILRYSCVVKWMDVFIDMGIKYVVFDEVQELRRTFSQKYEACEKISIAANSCQGLSATPMFNLGGEIYNVLNAINPGCLGDRNDFAREWMDGGTFFGHRNKVNAIVDTKAFGAYLREAGLMLRRTRAEVRMQVPPINTLIYEVNFDQQAIDKEEELCKALAMRVVYAEDIEDRVYASGQLDMRMRQITGISKAKGVAEFVKMMLDNGETVLLGGWHKAVYRIWEQEFREYNPVWYTGREMPHRKRKNILSFINKETKLMIMSLKSGQGADGIQDVCDNVVYGELDYSPMVHRQFTGRSWRPRQKKITNEIYLNSGSGSDPGIISTLGIKSSQSHGIMDPFLAPAQRFSDDSRVKKMAMAILEKYPE